MNIDISQLSETLTKMANDTVERVVQLSVEQMQTLAPVDSGELKDSIGIERVDDKTIVVGASVPYAPFVEQGTEKMQPQPFVRPTVDSIDAIIKRAIK